MKDLKSTGVGKMSNRIKNRIQLREKKVKVERPFPNGANINASLSTTQRQKVIDILTDCRAAFVSDSVIYLARRMSSM